MKCAIIIGHTHRSKGAYSRALGSAEYEWNERLSIRVLAKALEQGRGNDFAVFRRDGGGVPQAYALAKSWGWRDLQPLQPRERFGTIELHFNAAAPEAHGTEVIYSRPESLPLARALAAAVSTALGTQNRGAKLPWQQRGEASLEALAALAVPSVIVEPFFGSSARDAAEVDEAAEQDALAAAIVAAAIAALS